MEAGEQRVALSEVTKPKEHLSDDEMGNLIAAVGNHESKAISLVVMEPGAIYPEEKLYEKVMQAQGKVKGWVMHRAVPFKYCINSLSPIGLVTKEALDEDLSTYGYIKTPYGENRGDPLAGVLLKFSYEHPDVSLQDFFGATNSSSKQITTEKGVEIKERAPNTRLKIFWQLLTQTLPLRDIDLARALGRETTTYISTHIQSLRDKKIITYDAIKKGESFSFYQLSPKPPQEFPPSYMENPSSTAFVYQALLQNKGQQWTRDTLADHYLNSRKKDEKPLSREALKVTISGILAHLERQGYVKREKFSSAYHSEISLTNTQRQIMLDLVTLLDKFQNQDPQILQEGKEFADYLRTHPEVVSSLLAKTKEHSPNANQTSKDESQHRILSILNSSDEPLTNQEIRESLKVTYGQSLSPNSIRILTSSLSPNYPVASLKEKGLTRYQVISDNKEE